MNGDIVRMRHNILSASSEVVGEFTRPVLGIYSLINLVDITTRKVDVID